MKDIEGITGPSNEPCTVTEHREMNPLLMKNPFESKANVSEGFDTGDEVTFLCVKGIVIDDGKSTWHKFMTVELENGRTFTFEPDGSFFRGSDVCLFLIAKNKVKQKVKRWRWVFAVRDADGFSFRVSDNYYSEEEAAEKICGTKQKIDASEELQDA